MTEREIETKLAELDRLLNDPETRMDPDRVWALLAEVSAPAAPGRATGTALQGLAGAAPAAAA
uniref:hypothetical protein n=1 Tax=Falsiroseomonas oryziterrae TaxID=2911368 RepID=UPI001F3901C1